MYTKFTAALFAALVLASLATGVEARPVSMDHSGETNSGSFYDVPHELRHWYDRNYSTNG